MTATRDIFNLVGFNPLLEYNKNIKKVIALLQIVVLSFMTTTLVLVWANESGNSNSIPLTGFQEFDDMYHYYMVEKEHLIVSDIMNPVNDFTFQIIKLAGELASTLLLFLFSITIIFAVWYGIKPEFAESVSEVKSRVAAGEKIPIENIADFFKQFLPDIKANSGIADSYQYEKPSLALIARDHMPKFILVFAIIIALRTGVLITFVMKSSTALNFGFKYYTENIDFIGHINTLTTAGKDFNPYYDTVTTRGRNKKKLYNSMYNALKAQVPRDRTENFLGKIGSAVATEISRLEELGDVQFDYKNFSVNTTILPYSVEPDKSDVKLVLAYSLAENFGMIIGKEIPEDRNMYVTIFQYELAPDEDKGGGPEYASGRNTYPNAWDVGSKGYPVRLNIHDEYKGKLATMKFSANSGLRLEATAYYSDGSSSRVNVSASVTDTTATVDLTPLGREIDSKTGATTSLTRIVVTGFKDLMLVPKTGTGNSEPLPAQAQWHNK